jgi:hypothetical protein
MTVWEAQRLSPPPGVPGHDGERTMARNHRKNPTQKLAIDDTSAGLPKARKQKADVTLAEALAEQAAEEGKTVEEVVEELTTAEPTEAEKPTRPAGTSNLACTIRQHRKNYAPMLHPNGKKTQNNGDPVAVLLLQIPLATLKNYGGMRFDGRRYDHLNDGHARMCIGNLIRAAFKKGEGDVIEWLLANQPKQEVEADEEEAA